ncbi:MAG: response regulator transcription factor [Spirochaetes bacterium]|nr:response regulator transcription factor [Spirochaetota bacterium]
MKALIVDDEKHARERLSGLLKELDFFTEYFETENADEAVKIILKEDISAAFFDINMPGQSIFEVLKKMKNPPVIIFHTAYSEHAARAFDVEAVDYLLKPVSMERLIACVEKIKRAIGIKKSSHKKDSRIKFLQKIAAKKEGRIILINIEDVIKISSFDGLTFAFTKDQKYMLDRYLNYYEENLDCEKFFRINRTDLINLKFIKNIHPMFNGNYIIELENGDQLNLSRRKKSEFKKIYRLT